MEKDEALKRRLIKYYENLVSNNGANIYNKETSNQPVVRQRVSDFLTFSIGVDVENNGGVFNNKSNLNNLEIRQLVEAVDDFVKKEKTKEAARDIVALYLTDHKNLDNNKWLNCWNIITGKDSNDYLGIEGNDNLELLSRCEEEEEDISYGVQKKL